MKKLKTKSLELALLGSAFISYLYAISNPMTDSFKIKEIITDNGEKLMVIEADYKKFNKSLLGYTTGLICTSAYIGYLAGIKYQRGQINQ